MLAAWLAPRSLAACARWPARPALALRPRRGRAPAWPRDVVAAERILREGAARVRRSVAARGVLLAALAAARRALRMSVELAPWPGRWSRSCWSALAVRLVLAAAPAASTTPTYASTRLFAWQLARRGLVDFLRDFTANQYRYSLGLQLENGHWYAFPYPPAFYLLSLAARCTGSACGPRSRSHVLAAAVEQPRGPRSSSRSRGACASRRPSRLAAAACLPLLPIFLARLSLAYFPALVGHASTRSCILVPARAPARLRSARVSIAGSPRCSRSRCSTYTQSLLNFGILLPLFLLVADRARSRAGRAAPPARAGRRRRARCRALARASSTAATCRSFLDMRRGVPMPEEQILLEKHAQTAPRRAADDERGRAEPDDPYAGPGVDPLRGMRKAAWRLYVFYGPFALAVVGGPRAAAARDAERRARARFAVAWAATYLLLNLASGGLPGPEPRPLQQGPRDRRAALLPGAGRGRSAWCAVDALAPTRRSRMPLASVVGATRACAT